MNLRIACAAALICAPGLSMADPCLKENESIFLALVPSPPIVEAWRLCQNSSLAVKSGAACAEVDRKYAETGIAAREQAERDKAANDYAACALAYIRNVAAPE